MLTSTTTPAETPTISFNIVASCMRNGGAWAESFRVPRGATEQLARRTFYAAHWPDNGPARPWSRTLTLVRWAGTTREVIATRNLD